MAGVRYRRSAGTRVATRTAYFLSPVVSAVRANPRDRNTRTDVTEYDEFSVYAAAVDEFQSGTPWATSAR